MSGPSSSTTSSTKSRTLIVCFDGTTNEYGPENTNIVKLYSLFKRDDPNEQLCYYQEGIGTYLKPGIVSPAFTWIAKILDEAVAWYLDAHVMEGYTFLMQNYRAGDKICIFGFSRGAYTARALGGFLFKVGLLPRDNPEQLPFAYKLYKRTDAQGIVLCAGFKQTFSQNVNVEFLGVWDTVSSVGVVMSKTLPFTDSNTSIKTFRHALALDEHRAKFRPNLFHRASPNPSKDPEDASPVISRAQTAINAISSGPEKSTGLFGWRRLSDGARDKSQNGLTDHGNAIDATPSDAPDPAANDPDVETDVLEVWFSGCHSDIGGGAVADATEYSLNEITLRWMVREIVTSQCGILFDGMALQRNKIDLSGLGATSTLADSSELQKDLLDAVQPLHDELKLMPIWWLLEIIPTNYVFQDGLGVWRDIWSFHLGKGRVIPDFRPKFHTSVRDRIADAKLKYTPKAIWKAGTETYVE